MKKQIKLNDIKKIQLNILDYVADFCEKNDIKYWLACGTLLGAIRHKGYIPWDDDIDIGMLRDDYNKFIELFNTNGSKYEVHNYKTDKNWHLAFSKVYDSETVLFEPDEKTGQQECVNIDVFVYDNAPDDFKDRKRIYKKKEFYRKLNSFRVNSSFENPKNKKYNFLRYPLNFVLKIFPRNYFLKKMVNVSTKYINQNTKCVGNYSSKTDMVCSKKAFDKLVDVEFEGKKYKAPIGYDEYLTSFYGNYMKLPPKEKQVTHHSFVAYYKINK